MNNLLQLKGPFEQAARGQTPIMTNLPAGKSVNVSHLEKLRNDLVESKSFWSKQNIFDGALISVYYTKVAAKSNRIQGLLAKRSNKANSSIVGARFTGEGSPKHIITHYVSFDIINESIERLNQCVDLLNNRYNGVISHDTIKKINMKEIPFVTPNIVKANFLNVIVDAYYVEKFGILVDTAELKDESIITIYKTNVKATTLMEKLGINLQFTRVLDDTTILLRPDELALLKQKAPYLISMAVSDITKLTKVDFDFCDDHIITIPSPKNEPTIGVIDTMFDDSVYFSEIGRASCRVRV